MAVNCPFCDYEGPSPILYKPVYDGFKMYVIEPLEPITGGHVLFIPEAHLDDWVDAPWATARLVEAAADYVRECKIGDCNLISSRGEAATQTVRHLHLHVVPRHEGDGLALPWS